jgi:hypothetical protein
MISAYCPDCESGLAPNATSCRCGWALPAHVPNPQTVADTLAQRDAEHLARAQAWCAERGLTRRADESVDDWAKRMRQYMKENLTGCFKRVA